MLPTSTSNPKSALLVLTNCSSTRSLTDAISRYLSPMSQLSNDSLKSRTTLWPMSRLNWRICPKPGRPFYVTAPPLSPQQQEINATPASHWPTTTSKPSSACLVYTSPISLNLKLRGRWLNQTVSHCKPFKRPTQPSTNPWYPAPNRNPSLMVITA